MNAQETLAILEALHSRGAIHFKSGDFEVSFGAAAVTKGKPLTQDEHISSAMQGYQDGSLYNPAATKRAEDLVDLLKSKDEALLDKIFPAGAGIG